MTECRKTSGAGIVAGAHGLTNKVVPDPLLGGIVIGEGVWVAGLTAANEIIISRAERIFAVGATKFLATGMLIPAPPLRTEDVAATVTPGRMKVPCRDGCGSR